MDRFLKKITEKDWDRMSNSDCKDPVVSLSSLRSQVSPAADTPRVQLSAKLRAYKKDGVFHGAVTGAKADLMQRSVSAHAWRCIIREGLISSGCFSVSGVVSVRARHPALS